MKGSQPWRLRPVLIVAAVLALGWIVAGALGVGREGDDGILWDRERTIRRILPDSPAEHSGFRLGDRLEAVEGFEFRYEIGQTATYTVERQGETLWIPVTAGPMPAASVAAMLATAAMGVFWVLYGLWIHRRAEGGPAALFLICLLLGAISLCRPPDVPASLLYWVVMVGYLLLACTLLHFALIFPYPFGFVSRRLLFVVYLPAMVMPLMITERVLTSSEDSRHTLSHVIYAVISLQLYVWLMLVIIAFAVKFKRTGSVKRRELGLDTMVLGTVASLLPVVVLSFLQVMVLSGGVSAQPYLLLLSVMAVAVGSSVLKSHRAAAA